MCLILINGIILSLLSFSYVYQKWESETLFELFCRFANPVLVIFIGLCELWRIAKSIFEKIKRNWMKKA